MRHLSSLGALFCVVLVAAGCTDPKSTFDDFEDNVIDAAVVVEIDAAELDELPDITGMWFLALSPLFAPDRILYFDVRMEMTPGDDGGATLDAWIHPLNFNTFVQAPGDDLVSEGSEIDNTGAFTLELPDIVVDGSANPISGSEIQGDLVLHARIKGIDLVCGTVSGQVTRPAQLDMEGSTFAAQRIADDYTPDQLPEPLYKCPSEEAADAGPETPDAGAPDAGAPDAGAPDAGAPDAGAPDAAA